MNIRMITAVFAALLLIPLSSVTAYAGGGDCTEPEPPATEGPAEPDEGRLPEPNPFTPAGTGTVIDHATGDDEKEFYTIITPAENVFYLIIDRQRETENVYFLNAVTEADLLALAEIPPAPDPVPVEPAPLPPAPEPEPAPEKGGGMGMLLLVLLILLGGGGAGWYFKIYKPKQERADSEDDFDYAEEEADLYGGDDDPYSSDPGDDPYGGDPEEDDPPWDGDGDEDE